MGCRAASSTDPLAIKVLARAHQNLIWTRTRHTNALRSALREYYPAAVVAFEDLAHGDALGVLGRAPTPEQGANLSLTAIQSGLKRGGRQRNIAARARQIQTALRSEQLAAPAPVAAAFGATTRAAVGIIIELNRQIADLEAELATHFEAHPDADIYLSLPGLGVVLGARVLGEFGDDPNRYTDAKSRKNYAGTSPLTVASGKKRAVLARHVRNRRLYDAIDHWALCALTTSPGARAFYDQHRAAGDVHHQALRALGNRLVGILHGCLRHHTPYDEHTAWGHRTAFAA
jgi:Transposase IS116/IS110/IS902 family